jgi:hypothetical protein
MVTLDMAQTNAPSKSLLIMASSAGKRLEPVAARQAQVKQARLPRTRIDCARQAAQG